LQHSDERPPTSGRPSLLSSEQQAEADRHRILGGFDSKPVGTTAGPEKVRKGKLKWIVAGATVVALGAVSMSWLASEGEKEIILAGTAPLPSTAAPAAALASVDAEEVSTAAILEDTPVLATKAAAVADSKAPVDELSKLLEPQAAPRVAAKAPPKKPVVVAKAAPVKVVAKAAEKPQPMAMNLEPVVSKKKPVATPKAATNADSDVALLAALVAHSKATQAPKRSSGPASKLQQCKTLATVAEAEQCRARLCATTAKNESECKAPKLAKASSDT
jgi:hypothetical protein